MAVATRILSGITLIAVVLYLFTLSGFPSIGRPVQYIPMDQNNMIAVSSLTAQMSRLGAQVSSLAKEVKTVNSEMKTVKSEVRAVPTPKATPATGSVALGPPVERKTNFLSIGLGVIVDPYITNPTAGRELSYLQSFYANYWKGAHHRHSQPPLAAMAPWEDHGDCWCSTPRDGMSQIGILLGQYIVPEEVVVEHLPKPASLLPENAPKDIELWARFVDVRNKPTAPLASSILQKCWQMILPSSSEQFTFHEPIMNALRYTWPTEPQTAYSDDELLGPSFYRVGKFTYDINGMHHVQRFELDTVIDSPELRVDKVVFRVKSNWGGNHTCLYRLKLYGHT